MPPTPADLDQAGIEVEEPAVAGLVDRLRVDDVEPQAVVDRRLRVQPPGVLRVVEVAPLALARVHRRADVAPERGHVTEHEARQRQTAAGRPARAVVGERQLAGAVPVARHAQVVRAAHVDAELHAVAAPQLGDVADDLELLLVLIERAVAAANALAEARAESNAAAVRIAADEERRHARRKRAVEVQAGNARVRRRRRAEVGRQHVDVVAEPAEPEIGEQRRRERPIHAGRQALVSRVGHAAEIDQLDAAATLIAEHLRAVAQEVAQAVAAEHVQPVAHTAVEPHVDRVAVERLGSRGHVIVDGAVLAPGRVRHRHFLQQRQSLRRQAAGGDAVVRELLPRRRRPGRRIEDVHAVAAEIAGACSRRRHGDETRAADGIARALVIAEEEPLVSHDRSAHRGAELTLARIGQELAGERVGLELRERVAGLEPLVLVEDEPAAAHLVPSGLGLHRDHAGRRLAELGVVVLRCDFRLGDRLERRVDDDDAEDRVAVLGAVELIAGAAEMLAVDHRLRRSLRVLARGVLPAELLRAGRQQDELREVAIEHRQIGDLPRIERRRDVGAIGLEQRAEPLHGDRFAQRPDLHPDVEARLRVDVDLDVRIDRLLESRELDLDLVDAWQESILDELPRLVGHDAVHGLAIEAGDGDGHTRQEAGGRIGHRTGDASVDSLCERGWRGEKSDEQGRDRDDPNTVAHAPP